LRNRTIYSFFLTKDNFITLHLLHTEYLYTERTILKYFKIQLDTDLKIILLEHQSNLYGTLKLIAKMLKFFANFSLCA